ncbi:hypothetical protein LXL04_015939 [Taraxacum kok-saghyz]
MRINFISRVQTPLGLDPYPYQSSTQDSAADFFRCVMAAIMPNFGLRQLPLLNKFRSSFPSSPSPSLYLHRSSSSMTLPVAISSDLSSSSPSPYLHRSSPVTSPRFSFFSRRLHLGFAVQFEFKDFEFCHSPSAATRLLLPKSRYVSPFFSCVPVISRYVSPVNFMCADEIGSVPAQPTVQPNVASGSNAAKAKIKIGNKAINHSKIEKSNLTYLDLNGAFDSKIKQSKSCSVEGGLNI